MSELTFPIQVKLKNTNFNPFNEVVKEWEVDFLQLGNGRFEANLHQLIFPQIHFASVSFNSSVKQEGFSPPGIWSFAFVLDKNLIWRNYRVHPYSIIIYAPNSPIHAVSSPGFEVQIVSVADHLLREKLSNQLSILEKIENNVTLLPTRKDWESIFNWITDELENPPSKEPFQQLEKVINVIDNSEPYLKEASITSRVLLLTQVESFIQNHIKESISVKDLAMNLEVSERTLLYAIRERYGINTKAFIKALKLNAVHKALYKEENKKSIAQTAKEYGFWHMGQFHTDYKSYFGELPSFTKAAKV